MRLSLLNSHLLRLQQVRFLLLLVLLVVIASGPNILDLSLPYAWIWSVWIIYAVTTLLTWIRCRFPVTVTELELFIHFSMDVLLIATLLYFSGGAANPFVFYFLVPLSLAAAILRSLYAWILGTACLGLYTLLLFYYIPITELAPMLHPADHQMPIQDSTNLHISGMWLNFALSASLILYFVLKMSQALRDQSELLARQREENLRNEQLIGLAILAAGTAHELSTPLATIKTVTAELTEQTPPDHPMNQELNLIRQQVDICANSLKKLRHHAEPSTLNKATPILVQRWFDQLFEHWLLLRPNLHVIFECPSAPEVNFNCDPTLEQAVLNLLNNAADVSPKELRVVTSWTLDQIALDIYDAGEGIDFDTAAQLGKPFFNSPKGGLGLGFFLANATISRIGGTVQLFNRPEGGTLTKIRLPIKEASDVKQ